jgi:hypothetical protein
MQNQVVIEGKVEKDKDNKKKYKIKAHEPHEVDLIIELSGEDGYEVEKLSVVGLPAAMPDKTAIRWFNNFRIKKDGLPIKERYFVTIPDGGKSRLVIMDSKGVPYYFPNEIKNNTIELTDGDPAGGFAP